MGLTTAFKQALQGNFTDAANYLFISEDSITTTQQVSNAQEKLIAERAAQGTISEDQQAGYLAEIQRNAYPYLFNDFGGPASEFTTAMKEGIANLPKNFATGINKTIGEATKFTFRALPWYVWAIILVALLVYLAPFLTGVMKLYGRK